MIADLEDLEKFDASDVCLRRTNAKQMLIRQVGDECIFPIADCTAILAGGDSEFREPALRQESTVGSEDLSGENSRRIGRVSTVRTNRSKVTSSIVTRVQHFVPKEETFPCTLKYMGVSRSTRTDLDGKQEKPY